MAVGFIIKYIQTHTLGDIDYGEYAFFTGLTTFVVLFFRFGFFTSIQVLLAHNYNEVREKKLLGVGYILALANGILMAITLWIASFLVNDLFNTNIGDILKWLAPLTFIYPFDFLIGAYATGCNKIRLFSYYRFLPKIIYLLLLIGFHYTVGLNVYNTILLNLISTIGYGVFLIIYLKPEFKLLRSTWTLVWNKNKKFGIHEYTGSVLGQATYSLDQLFISYFMNTTQLGFYSLALLICTPMIMLSQAVSRSMYRSYSKRNVIPKKLLRYNVLWLAFCVLFLAVTAKYIVQYFFGLDFMQTADYIVPLSAVFFVHGLYIPYSFLEVKSMGKELRNTKIVESIVNVVGNIVLIPVFHVYGAIITSFVAKLVHYLLMRWYYLKYLKTHNITAGS